MIIECESDTGDAHDDAVPHMPNSPPRTDAHNVSHSKLPKLSAYQSLYHTSNATSRSNLNNRSSSRVSSRSASPHLSHRSLSKKMPLSHYNGIAAPPLRSRPISADSKSRTVSHQFSQSQVIQSNPNKMNSAFDQTSPTQYSYTNTFRTQTPPFHQVFSPFQRQPH